MAILFSLEGDEAAPSLLPSPGPSSLILFLSLVSVVMPAIIILLAVVLLAAGCRCFLSGPLRALYEQGKQQGEGGGRAQQGAGGAGPSRAGRVMAGLRRMSSTVINVGKCKGAEQDQDEKVRMIYITDAISLFFPLVVSLLWDA